MMSYAINSEVFHQRNILKVSRQNKSNKRYLTNWISQESKYLNFCYYFLWEVHIGRMEVKNLFGTCLRIKEILIAKKAELSQ